MMCPDRLGQWFVQIHRLGLLVEKELLAAGAPIEEEKVLLGSGTLDEVERMVLSLLSLWLGLGALWTFSLRWGLTGLGGIGT